MAEGKTAKELDASPKDVKRIIKGGGLEPAIVKGGCSCYNEIKIEINKRKLKE